MPLAPSVVRTTKFSNFERVPIKVPSCVLFEQSRAAPGPRMAPPSDTPRLLDLLTDTPDVAALHYALGKVGTDRTKRSTVAIRGLNPVGVEITRLLVKSGVGEIRLTDDAEATEGFSPLVTEADVAATDMFTRDDIGKPRLTCVLANLKERHPDKNVMKYDWLDDVDVLVTAWDIESHDYVDEAKDSVSKIVVQRGGVHVLAAAPGLFAFVRATHPPAKTDFEIVNSDARVTKAPVSMLESVVPIHTNSDMSKEATRALVTVCDTNAHGLRVGDGVEFFRTRDFSNWGKVVDVTGLHAFVVEGLPGMFSLDPLHCSLTQGAYVRQQRRIDAYVGDGFETVRSYEGSEEKSEHKVGKRKRSNDAPSAQPFVLAREIQSVSSFTFDADACTTPPSVNASLCATMFTQLNGHVDCSQFDSTDVSTRAVVALRRGARVSFPPSVGVAASVAAHEALKIVAGVQVPLGANGSQRRWFAHDFLELEPESTTGNAPAVSVSDLLGTSVVEDIHNMKRVELAASGRVGQEVLWQLQRIGKDLLNKEGPYSPIDEISDLDTLDLLIVATEGFSGRREACSLSTKHRFSLIDVGVDNHAVSTYVAAVDTTAPWSVSGARDPSDPEYPSCVLNNFPHIFPHCAKWARDVYDKWFMNLPDQVTEVFNSLMELIHEDKKSISVETVSKQLERFSDLHDVRFICEYLLHSLETGVSVPSLEIGVAWAKQLFYRFFIEGPTKALSANPLDAKTRDGSSFWSGTKRPPTPLTYDVNNPNHLSFVVAAVKIHGCFGATDLECLVELACESRENDFQSTTESEEETRTRLIAEVHEKFAALAKAVEMAKAERDAAASVPAAVEANKLREVELEEGEEEGDEESDLLEQYRYGTADPKFAKKMISAAAACRAEVYDIPAPSEFDLAFVATGSRPETPAPAVFAAALVAVETIKIAKCLGSNVTADNRATQNTNLRCSYASLGRLANATACPFPLSVKVAKTSEATPDLSFTPWDSIKLDGRGDVTLQILLDVFKKQVGLEPSMISHGASLLFADFHNQQKPETEKRMSTPLCELFSETTAEFVTLSITACDENDDDVDIPDVRVMIR